jgi:hypothetical protein
MSHLQPHVASPDEIQRLLAAAALSLADAARAENSPVTRYDCAYRAVMQCALAALLATGYRPSPEMLPDLPAMAQSLQLTLGLPARGWIILDAILGKRRPGDYLGVEIGAGLADEFVVQTAALLSRLRNWLATNHPQLLQPAA